MSRRKAGISEIGYWSEVKLDILADYASAYSKILAAQKSPRLKHIFIDAFSGSGVHIAKGSGDLVWGSPMRALMSDPPFSEYHFIDLDEGNVETLEMQVRARTQGPYDPDSTYFYNADCNQVLLTEVFPRARFEDYARALCLLDPYGLHLDWDVIKTAGQMRSLEIFLNFPIMDINRNVLHRDPSSASEDQTQRMTAFWGDASWRQVAYRTEQNLFGFEQKKTTNEDLAAAFRERLKKVAGFAYVPEPMPMRNTTGAVVYYLFFAARKPVAARIVTDIFDKYRDRRG